MIPTLHGSPALQAAALALASLDVLATHAVQAASLRWTQPTFSDTPGISIRGGRHPVVAAQVEHFIPNDVSLSPRADVDRYGPNMGGKSTYMRQTAIIALLAHCACLCPQPMPSSARWTRSTPASAQPTTWRAAARFMVEMTEAAYILNRATPASLVLIDEMGAGRRLSTGWRWRGPSRAILSASTAA